MKDLRGAPFGLIFALAAIFAQPANIEAEALPLPAGIEIPAYRPGEVSFKPGQKLVYKASWLGIPAATATIEIRGDSKDASHWIAEARLNTNKVVDALFKMRDYLREDLDSRTLQASSMYIMQHENRRRNEFLVDFDRKAQIVRAVKRNSKGSETREFKSANPNGPISGALLALSQPMKQGGRLRFDVFSGRNRFVFEFNAIRRERLHLAMGDFDAWRVSPRILYLSNDDERKKARDTTVWISADHRHLPLRIEAAAFIGYVRADLVEVIDPPGSVVSMAGDQVGGCGKIVFN